VKVFPISLETVEKGLFIVIASASEAILKPDDRLPRSYLWPRNDCFI